MSTAGITLQLWTDDDLPILHQTVGNAEMMEHLGGIETPERIAVRHERYMRRAQGSSIFTVRIEDGAIAGTIGFWEREWQGSSVYETGWMILPRYAGRGIATAAALMIVECAKAEGRHRFLHAYPSVENIASNAVCRKAGFTQRGEYTFEYPKGHFMRCYDWQLDLAP
jgi:RimJ/RimL family protein N-acetyltransferase